MFDWFSGIGDSLSNGLSSLWGNTTPLAPDSGTFSFPSDPGGLNDVGGGFASGGGSYTVPGASDWSFSMPNTITAPTAPSPQTGGGSWWSDVMGGLGNVARAAAPALGLATSGMGLYAGIKGMQDAAEQKQQLHRANQTQEAAGNSALSSGQQLTTAGTQAMMGGPLPAGLEAQAKQYEDSLRAQINNYLAKSGQGVSSAAQQWESYIAQQAAIYRQQLASGLLQPGSTNLGIASGSASRGVGQYQATQNGIGTALDSANRALNQIAAAAPRQKKPGEA